MLKGEVIVGRQRLMVVHRWKLKCYWMFMLDRGT